MTAKYNLEGITWQCTCGKWNNSMNTDCWSCHSPKSEDTKRRIKMAQTVNNKAPGFVETRIDNVKVEAKPKRGRPKGSKNKPKEEKGNGKTRRTPRKKASKDSR